MKKIIVIFIVALFAVNTSFAQSVFELKGKDIYITSTSFDPSSASTTIPEECIRDKNGKVYKSNIIGRAFYVSDVKTNGSSKNIKSVDITLVNDTETVIFRFPMKFKDNEVLLSMCRNPQSKKSGSSVSYTTNINDICITYYNKQDIDYLIDRYPAESRTFYNPTKMIDNIEENKLYIVNGGGFEENTGVFYMSLQPDQVAHSIKLPLRANNATEGVDFSEMCRSLVYENDVIEKCKTLYNLGAINHWRNELKGREIYWHGMKRDTLIADLSSFDQYEANYKELKEWYEEKPNLVRFGNFLPDEGYYWVEDVKLVRYDDNPLVDYKYFIIIGMKGLLSSKMLPLTDKVIKNISYSPQHKEYKKYIEEEQRKERLAKAQAEAEAQAAAEAKAAAESMAKYEREELARKNNLIRKYGQVNGELIYNRKVAIGFTKQMCLEAKGQPTYKQSSTTQNEVIEVWIYEEWWSKNDTMLSFYNNALVKIDSY